MQYGLQHGHQELLADLARTAHHLPLRDGIHGIDVVDALGSVPVALMHGVDAQESGPALRIGSAPLGDRNRRGPCGLEHRRLFPVVRAPAQVVQMRHRDSRQRPKLLFAELLVLPFENAQRGRSAQPLVRAVHLGQQRDVPFGVFAREPPPLGEPQGHMAGALVLPDKPCHLRSAQPGDLLHVSADCSPVLLLCPWNSWATSTRSTQAYTSTWFAPLKTISSLAFKKSLICWRVRLSLFCMRICIRPQNARPTHPQFMIILYWKPVPFHDHLVLDNSDQPMSLGSCYDLIFVSSQWFPAVVLSPRAWVVSLRPSSIADASVCSPVPRRSIPRRLWIW